MTGQKHKSARTVTLEVLNRCNPAKNYAGNLLDKLQHETEQKQRATDLVFGTLRNRRSIDTVIATFSGRKVDRIQRSLLNIIRIGTYELIYCPSTEQYAIVNEAVLNAKAAGSEKQTGFVNAVLREITRHIRNRCISLSKIDTKCTLPHSLETGCQFDTAFLPDYDKNPVEYLSTIFSLPQWLVAIWLEEFGGESSDFICFASNRKPSVYIRPNRLRTTAEALTEKLVAAGIEYEIVPDLEMIRIQSPRSVTKLPGFSEGLFTIQDITASKPVRMLNPLPDLKILDLCAAPGTKATQLAEITGDSAEIIATDVDDKRLEMVRGNTVRLGIKSVNIVPYKEVLKSQFDCILLDVPCSNTGVLAKRVEVRYRISPNAIKKLIETQAELLESAAKLTRPGGIICYSTCSIQKSENSELIKKFIKTNLDFTLESEQLTLPSAEGFDYDGGYCAILAKH